ncbi:MAG: hypothetical protein OEX19_13205, partial [Gammaproteobacteria bacterium]|nr:hypothetical protein [Gammaproteobacteria bacterium]
CTFGQEWLWAVSSGLVKKRIFRVEGLILQPLVSGCYPLLAIIKSTANYENNRNNITWSNCYRA